MRPIIADGVEWSVCHYCEPRKKDCRSGSGLGWARGNVMGSKSPREEKWPAQDMPSGRHTQSDSAGCSMGMVWMPIVYWRHLANTTESSVCGGDATSGFLPHHMKAVNCGKLLFLAQSLCVFCLCMKYLRNHWMDLCQIHTEDLFSPSLGQVWR